MKFQKSFLFLIIFFAGFQICLGQEKSKPVLLGSLVEPNCERLLHDLDYFAIELLKETQSIGYIVVYGEQNPIRNVFYRDYIKNYQKRSGIDENRFRILTTNGEDKIKVEFWKSESGEKPKIVEQEFSYQMPDKDKKYYFVEEAGEVLGIEGKSVFMGDCPACCLEHLDFYLLAKLLEANPNFTARFTVYWRTKKKPALQLIRIIADEVVNDHKIPRNRLKIIDGGKNNTIYAWNNNMAQVNVWLVPRNKK